MWPAGTTSSQETAWVRAMPLNHFLEFYLLPRRPHRFYDRFPSSILQRREQVREAGNARGHGIESSQLVGNLISYQSFSGLELRRGQETSSIHGWGWGKGDQGSLTTRLTRPKILSVSRLGNSGPAGDMVTSRQMASSSTHPHGSVYMSTCKALPCVRFTLYPVAPCSPTINSQCQGE